MFKSIHRISFFITIMLLTAVNLIFAQDWPQWRGIQRDGKIEGYKAPQHWPAALKSQWTLQLGAGDATPALVGKELYVFIRQGDDEVLFCLNAETGKEIWQNKYPARKVSGPPSSHPGPASSPTVSDGKVFIQGVSGILSCLDGKTGKLFWRNEEYAGKYPDCYISVSPLVVYDVCITHIGGDTSGYVLAFDIHSGAVKWSWRGDGPAFASPMLATIGGLEQIIVQTAKNIIGLACKDGSLLWQYSTPAERRYFNAATPVIDGSTVIVTGQGKGTKALSIVREGNAFRIKELWNNEKWGTLFNTPVLKNGLVFGVSDREYFFCLDSQNGQMAWMDSTKLDRFASIIDAGVVLFIQHGKSDLIVVKPDTKKFIQLARYKVSEKPVYAHPVITGNKIYIKDTEFLTLWTID
jgi:outer membrane protein assembly factor BamB